MSERHAWSPIDDFSRVVRQSETDPDRLSIGVAMLLIAGAAVGFWLAVDQLRREGNPNGPSQSWVQSWIYAFVFILGGVSLVGPPLLLVTALRRPWAAGRFLWFTQGTAAWLLWPPAIIHRVTAAGNQEFDQCGLFFLRHAAHGSLRHALAPGRRAPETIAPAQDAPFVARDVRAILGACVGVHRPLYHFTVLSPGHLRQVIGSRRKLNP